jgi:radical SAM superfamily enzyme YgiQ (UPF0313 family)
MADVLLTHCNHLYFDRKQVRKMQPYPPLQTLLAASSLRQAGYEVALYDSTFQCPPEQGFVEALDEHRPRLVALCEDNFNFLTKMCLTRNRDLAFSMARAAKDCDLQVIVNSSDATDQSEAYLNAGADFVMVGELERTLVELVPQLLGEQDSVHSNGISAGRVDGITSIPGLVFRDSNGGGIQRTAPRALMTDLDQLPLPAWDLVKVDEYRARWKQAHGFFSLNMISSRGCPYRCNWCAKPIYGETYHYRSPEAVAEEMALVKATLQPDQIWFADDIFALSGDWTRRFAAAVDERGARIPFKMQSRCDLMTRDTVEALRRAGCEEVWMGAESGSQKILDAMDKDLRVEEIYRARENLRRHGVRACYFVQFGYPGETWDDIQKTVQMVRDTEPADIGVSVSYALPGTVFHERVASQLDTKRNWSHSDDLSMMFQGAYRSEFYRALRDALHFEVECCNGRSSNGHADRLAKLWHNVEELKETCANSHPTPVWTSC